MNSVAKTAEPKAEVGHNSKPRAGGVNADRLKSYMQRIEKLEQEKIDIADAMREIFADAKDFGFCTKTMHAILKVKKMDASEREERENLMDTYMHALGMLPLFDEKE